MDLEHATARRMMVADRRPTVRITIPVVVHVVYNDSSENISLAQIKSQIAVLNKDFRATNSDKSKVPTVWKGLLADAGVQFALAKKDPGGRITRGVTWTHTTKTAFSIDDDVKSTSTGGVNPWPTNRFLNVWVCTLGDGLLGYAQFPGGPANTDGVVILNTAFGTTGTASVPFNFGRTTTHEIGHWLNLHHIWGGGLPVCSDSDFVSDTPNQEGPNYGKPTFPHLSCSNAPNGDMFMNYMDYVDDDSMFMFTPQQVIRMQAALTGPRNPIGRR
jgi:hypothetical protein